MVVGAFNSTFIIIKLEKDNLDSFNEFTSISLCNCIYKIILKIIALKVNKIFFESISKEQFVFLHRRQIHNATGVAQEGLHCSKTNKLLVMVLKLDLSKAYATTN